MRYSRLFGKTLREKPRNADSRSHELLLRAGFLRPAPGGGFVLLPLAERALSAIGRLLTGELSSLGVQTLSLAAGRRVQNSDLRRSLELERREATSAYPFAAPHEIALAALAGNLSLSYRDLPLTLMASQWAVREDSRPNWGLLVAPEFLFHSVYFFCATDDEAASLAGRVRVACQRALKTSGISCFDLSSEFAIATNLNARPILACDECSYHADADTAVSCVPEWPQDTVPGEAKAVYGPGLIQVEPLAEFLGIPVHQTTKTLLFEADGRVIAASVAGVYDVSETKLKRILGSRNLGLASAETVRELTNSEVGYAGPGGLPDSVEIIWDMSTEHRTNFEAGANRTDHHMINLNFGRDLPHPQRFVDIRRSREGERCVRCSGGKLHASAAVALGHVSTLGGLYTDTLGARFLDPDKSVRTLRLGCAGLDLTAILAAVVEQNNDDRGIIWPLSTAPFTAHLVSLPPAEADAETLYRHLTDTGVDVLWDDRPESAGVKFADADLIGLPIRLVMSKRTAGQVEWKPRAAAEGELISPDETVERFHGFLPGSPNARHAEL